jgi:UDP-N-acetylmuramate-alanine ligase
VRGVDAEFGVDFVETQKSIEEWLRHNPSQNRPLLILGAGDIYKMIPLLLKKN